MKPIKRGAKNLYKNVSTLTSVPVKKQKYLKAVGSGGSEQDNLRCAEIAPLGWKERVSGCFKGGRLLNLVQ
jgi:hypothetical protein